MGTFLDIVAPLIAEGFAVLRLKPRKKEPVEERWPTSPVYTQDQLRAAWQPDNNVGVRLGEPSCVAGHYLHAIDMDVRDPGRVGEAHAALAEFIPEFETLPFVISGSGGESRHYFFLTSRPFASKRNLRHSPDKMIDEEGKPHRVWEVDLFGTGRFLVLPPSIHPDTGLAYRWGREFDFGELPYNTFGAPFIDAARVERWAPESLPLGENDDELTELVRSKPLENLSRAEIDGIIGDLMASDWCNGRDPWVTIGQALSHQFEGSDEGLTIFIDLSRGAPTFDERKLRAVWRSFKGHHHPVTFASLIDAVKVVRFTAAAADDHDDVDLSADDDDDGLDGIDELLGRNDEPSGILPLLDWKRLLDLNEAGAIRHGSAHNIELIVRNDERLVGVPRWNEFTLDERYRGEPGFKAFRKRAAKPCRQLTGKVWTLKEPMNGDIWQKKHTTSVRSVISAPKTQGGYGFTMAKDALEDTIKMIAHDHPFHPIKDYLESLQWDGVERIDTLYIRYLGTPDTPYHRAAARLPLIAAVTRIYEPGHKFDYVPILEGSQGIRKSSFVAALGRFWFGELTGDFAEREKMVAKMVGKWVIEIPELSGFHRNEIQDIKAAISAGCDTVRLSYRPDAQDYQRQSVFFGTTNARTYLRDETGNRRFWPVRCLVDTIDTDALIAEIDQVWAEALAVYRAMRLAQPKGMLPLYLADPEAAREATQLQRERMIETPEDELAGAIRVWLDQAIGTGFNDEPEPGAEVIRRNITCGMEIWCEMMGEPKSRYGRAQQLLVNGALAKVSGWEEIEKRHYFKKYDRQRTFVRSGSQGK